jgi:hypothetical protein
MTPIWTRRFNLIEIWVIHSFVELLLRQSFLLGFGLLSPELMARGLGARRAEDGAAGRSASTEIASLLAHRSALLHRPAARAARSPAHGASAERTSAALRRWQRARSAAAPATERCARNRSSLGTEGCAPCALAASAPAPLLRSQPAWSLHR